jgi:hypothetical protein
MINNELMVIDDIQQRIYTTRGVQIMLDEDLSVLYQVKTKVLNQAVKRNKDRFPENFCFKLTIDEYERLRSRTVTLENDGAFTAQDMTFDSKRGIPSTLRAAGSV